MNRIATMMISIMCIGILIAGCSSPKPPSLVNGGITAKDKIGLATNISKDWKMDASLKMVSPTSDFYKGKANGWYYIYYSPSSGNVTANNTTMFDSLSVYIYANGSSMTENNNGYADSSPINNWTLDSDQAYETMLNDSAIRSFISRDGVNRGVLQLYPPSKFVDSLLRNGINKNDDAVWYARWERSSLYKSPLTATMIIDANTGAVEYKNIY